jgi:hypothetical protein
MKTSSAAKRVEPATARNSFLINQLATPGLGSLLAGRYLAGTGQLLLAIAGFLMVVAWFVVVAMQMYEQIEEPSHSHSVAWLGEIGGVTFAAAWFWALATSLSLLREAKLNQNP